MHDDLTRDWLQGVLDRYTIRPGIVLREELTIERADVRVPSLRWRQKICLFIV